VASFLVSIRLDVICEEVLFDLSAFAFAVRFFVKLLPAFFCSAVIVAGNCSILSGILNETGEFTARLPRYCEDEGESNVIVEFLIVEDEGGEEGREEVKNFCCRCCNAVWLCSTISILLNKAGVFPWFKILPTRYGVLPMYLILGSFTEIFISPTTIAPKLKEAVFSW
jgi:hypothetical protein